MACGARSGLKLNSNRRVFTFCPRLNGLWSPFGIETIDLNEIKRIQYGLNGLWSPFGIETAFSFSPFCHSLWLNGLWSPFEGRK